ncbi:MAG TPA: ABC transporter substrate-binding protein [Chloroflexota bacterium]|jgi:peptide/nickel transport system substrate-binding protein|nr:ABC transporter substrate-binding protein [Chloroflexota bacterium]
MDRRGFLRHAGDLSAGLTAGGLLGPAALACRPRPAAPGESEAQVAPDGKPVRGGTFTVGSISDAKTMQPLLSQDTASSAYTSLHYNAPLLRTNPETLKPDATYGAAESFQISADSLTLTFKLKPGLQWSDGRPITAADYKFTHDRMMDPQVAFPYRALYSLFNLEAPDERTLVFQLKEPFCPAVEYAAGINPIPKHVFEGQDINDSPHNLKPAVGSGPWLMQEWVKDSHAVFVANDKFYLGRPHLDRYVYRVVESTTVAYSMLKTGEVDQAGIQAIDWEEAKRLEHIRPINYYPASAAWLFIGFNMRHEMLKDLRVRQALAYAINRKEMIDAIRLGHAKPLHSIYASASWAYTDDVPKLEYDVARAKRLLDEAGWRPPAGDPNGTRVKDGKPLKMRIFYNAGNKEREQIATIAQQQAKAIGVELDVISEEWNAYLERISKTRDIELFVNGWSSSLEPHGSMNLWITTGGQNDVGLSIPRVDELYPRAAAVPGCSQDDRQKVYAEIQKLIAAESPYIFLWENESLSGLHKRFVPNPLTRLGYSYRAWEWHSTTGQ